MKADAAFVRADGIVVLHAPATLHADVTLVVLPADAETDHPVGLGDAAEDLVLVILLLVLNEVEDVLRNLLNRLHVLGLARVAPLEPFDKTGEIDMT